MKKYLKKIYKNTLECADAVAKQENLKDVTDWDVDLLAESIELLNDVYELLYDKVFDDSLLDE